MAEILNKYKRWKPRLIINREKELDFVLSQDNSAAIEITGDLTKRCLISYIDTNIDSCVDEDGNLSSFSGFTYENYLNNDVKLDDFGFTGIDNGRVIYDNTITLNEFIGVLTGTSIELENGDPKLHLYPVQGNSKYYEYQSELMQDDKDRYYAFKGGFVQGFYKINGCDYEVLPSNIERCWNLEFVIRPRTDYEESGMTLNAEHPENKGIFFYIGTRSENKFGRFNGEDLAKYPFRGGFEDNCFDLCEGDNKNGATISDLMWLYNFLFEQPTDENLCGKECQHCHDSGETETSLTSCAIEIETSNGHKLDNKKYFEVTTDNKYLIFDRTKDGYTADTWDDDDAVVVINQEKFPGNENLFLLMNRGKSGYTVNTIDRYFDSVTGQSKDYSIMNDVKNNAFALKVNEDGSVGYKYLIKDCDSDSGYSVVSENSFPGIIESDKWNTINVMFKIMDGGVDGCGKSLGNRKMKIFIYVNGYLKLVSKELPEFRFRELNEYYDKQEGVPFNISLGGGTQGLAESMWVDNYKHPYCRVLPIEENFGGTFIGDIRSFKFYDCQLQYNEIKNNSLYEMVEQESHESIIKNDIIYYGFATVYTTIPIAGEQMKSNKNIRSRYTALSQEDNSHFFVILSKQYTGAKPIEFTCGGAPMVMNEREEIIDGTQCIVFESGEIYAPGVELSVLSDNI